MAVLFSVLLAGCLGEPEIQDRWTRIDVLEANLRPGQVLLDLFVALLFLELRLDACLLAKERCALRQLR